MIRHKRIGYDLKSMLQSACLVKNPITVDNSAALFNCTPVDRMLVGTGALSSVAWSTDAQLMLFLWSRFPVVLFGRPGISIYYAKR